MTMFWGKHVVMVGIAHVPIRSCNKQKNSQKKVISFCRVVGFWGAVPKGGPGGYFWAILGPKGGTITIHRNDYKRFLSTLPGDPLVYLPRPCQTQIPSRRCRIQPGTTRPNQPLRKQAQGNANTTALITPDPTRFLGILPRTSRTTPDPFHQYPRTIADPSRTTPAPFSNTTSPQIPPTEPGIPPSTLASTAACKPIAHLGLQIQRIRRRRRITTGRRRIATRCHRTPQDRHRGCPAWR